MALRVLQRYSMLFGLLLVMCYLNDARAARGFRQSIKHGQSGLYGLSKSLKNSGLFPSTFNVATKAEVFVNATCGEEGPETFCKPSESSRCAVCDARSPDPGKRHNISNVLDSSSGRWWQSPTLARGDQYEYVTIVLDLKQVYQVEYVIVKAANSPRPAAWILERSIDGENFQPWQYYAPSDEECWSRYSTPPVSGKPIYIDDNDVICTSLHSRQTPMENGEVHTHLVNGRPGALNHSKTLQEFTQARYVRLRLQGLRRNGEPIADKRRAFYSIKEINIGGRCLCSGHAARCRYSVQHGHQECECERHTCGERCEKCCPMYNQIPWKPGTAAKGFHCEKCNCNGHATSCRYDQEVADRRMSMDIRGKFRGGGICNNCTENTAGINCERCQDGYYRPNGIAPDAPEPCLPCNCNAQGSTGYCTPDDSFTHVGKVAGACDCKPGYSGYKCDQCAAGYRQFPDCMPCPCDSRGILPSHDCEGDCLCKANVAGEFCDKCKPGHFALTKENLDGCLSCYCFGVSDRCTAAKLFYSSISSLENWLVTDMNASRAVIPILDTDSGWLTVAAFEVEYDSPFWLAPPIYCGNRVSSYGSNITYSVAWVVMRGDTSGKPTTGPNVILVGNNGMRIAYGEEQYNGQEAEIIIPLRENGWYHVRSEVQDISTRLRRTEFRGDPVTRTQMMMVLADLKHLMIRAQYHSEQIEGSLQSAAISIGEISSSGENNTLVELCECPAGYTGLSCEDCAWGYVKVMKNESDHQSHHVCVKCDCNGHAGTCDLLLGDCTTCEHNTVGPKCDRCAPGFYGIALKGTPNDCKRCACPLLIDTNNFSPNCQLDDPTDIDSGYICTQCPEGYTGDHCESCDVGFFGNPLIPDGACEPCSCSGGPCDQETGRCLECRGNTEGWKCDKCKHAHYGNPLEQNCLPCSCDPIGSSSLECEERSGQCPCKPLFEGRDCSSCIEGYGNVTAGCRECDCDVGALDEVCDPVTGECRCADGVLGFRCDRCVVDHYGLSVGGCGDLPTERRESKWEQNGELKRSKVNSISEFSDQIPDDSQPHNGSPVPVVSDEPSIRTERSLRLKFMERTARRTINFVGTQDEDGFFRNDHRPIRSSAKMDTFGSGGDRWRERKILEKGRREESGDWSPGATDLSVDFRAERGKSDGKIFDGYEITDRPGDQDNVNVRGADLALSFLPGNRGEEGKSAMPDNPWPATREFDGEEKSVHQGFHSRGVVSSVPRVGDARDSTERGSMDRRSSSLAGADSRKRENRVGRRRKRYTNYYSPQSATPMAYVHIQPAYPAPMPPPANRNCVRCMVVYKPCPSPPRPPPRIVLPTYKYQEPASNWHGLKYGCRCNPIGSMTTACDIVTGQCQCKPHITGRQCDQCMIGFWGLTTGTGCAPCECDPIGSNNASCHDTTGQCYCKSGVGGTHCDVCLPGYYGFSSNGCQVCDPCVRPGHICDPDTGRCVCPNLTFGEHCDRCRPGSWDLVPGVGCRPCACTLGSMRPQCDLQGQCPCRIGYDGLRCEKCAKGYYGYPRCRPCSCNLAGTLQCDDEVCDCDENGQCPCKDHVIGKQCNQCKEGTFGLAVDNPKGCTECFCFGRTASCQESGLSWGQRKLAKPRILYVNDTNNDIVVSKFRSQIFLSPVNGGLNVTNGLSTISDVEGDVTIPSNLYYNYPLYWMLPESFLGDKVVSYGGFLRFTTLTEGGIPLRSTLQYPVVQLQGNDKIVLEYYLPLPVINNHYEIRFHESLWQLQNRPDYKVTREVLMVALQNIQHILIKASDSAEFMKAVLLEASMDAAVLTPTHTPSFATGVEICKCPPEYNSTSCQDPSIGYYRWYKNTTVTSTIVIDLVGQARRCQCSGRSEVCDIETGYCLNCRENTAGPRCDICTESFYGHPELGGCKPCPCPQTDKRFSNTCMVRADTEPLCVCKPGYSGRTCERCSHGYYGSPHLPDGSCVPCDCNPAGSLSDECDSETGQCRCRAGSTGRDCSECTAYRHVYINNVCTSCNDNCTGVLLDTVAILSQELAKGTTHIANGYIPPPWEDLSIIDSNTTAFFEEIDLESKLRQRMKNVPWHEHRKLFKHVESLFKTVNEYAQRADMVQTRSDDLKNNIYSAKIEIENLRKHIEDTIFQLTQYSNDNKRIEIKKALKTAKMILNNLKTVNLTTKTMEIQNFIEDVAEYTEWLNSLYDPTEPLAIAQDDTEEYTVKLNDMRNVIEDTMETLFTYDGLYNNINQTLVQGRDVCNEINMISKETNESIDEGEKLKEETRGFVIDMQNNLQDLPELQNKLTYWFDKLNMNEELLYRLNYEYNGTYVVPAVEHARNLSNFIDQYISLFSETRNIAASPLKASQAYNNIVDAIQMANITAMTTKDIAEDTYNKTFPGGSKSKSLLDNAEEISSASSKQWESSNRHGKLVEKANDNLDKQKQAVNILKSTLSGTGIRDNEVNVKLQSLDDESKKLRKDIQNVLDDNDEVLEAVGDTKKLIDDYTEGITNRLKPKLYELKREGDSKISLASEKLTEALSNIRKADAKLISLSNAAVKRKNVFDKWNDTLATKLQNLKDKIAEARNTADGIRVSLKSAEGKECIRSYRPSTLQPSSMNTIVMTFAMPKGRKEGSLFYLPNGINDDFLALEIIDRKVRFVWNVGGGTGILTYPQVIEAGDPQDDSSWYRVEAERILHVGTLLVKKQSSLFDGFSTTSRPVTNSTDSAYGRFDVTTSDRVWIGGIPRSQRRRTELIASNGLPACVHQVILDGKPIGLWNFISTAPDMACKPCVEGMEDARDDVVYSFNGEGYAVRNRSSRPYNRYTFEVSLNFRTFDENALLFLAINPKNNQHIMIFLQEGKVILHIGYGGNVSMDMSSKNKYNTGNWTKVDAFRQYQLHKNIEKCRLNVGGDADKRIGAPTPQPKKDDIPDFAQAKYYIGGVPPSFRADKIMLPTQVSFLGCMSNINVQEGYDPTAEQYYGVEPSCGNKTLKIVGFYGDGYLEHTAYTLRKINSSMSFSFRTVRKDAVLLLSIFEDQEERMSNIRHINEESNRDNYYSVCLINGQVQVRLNIGRGRLILQSNDTFNDGRYHSVTVIKTRKEIELRIDDAYQSKGKLQTNAAIRAPDSGGLFFGGLPVLINSTKMIATTTPLYGAIKDAVFNGKIVRFNDVVRFEHALIGRPGPSMGIDPPTYTPSASLSRGMSTQPEGCQKVPYYSLEPGALKFGDKPNSHTQLYLNFKKFWEKKYAIEFDFRTYYPNGLLFITPGLRPKNYLMVIIRDGQLVLLVKSKQKKEMVFKTPFNDGNWHHVVISHDERKLTLLVDSQTPRTIKVPRKIGLASMMYIGGLPESGTPIPEQVVVKLETLKGCIKGLRVNGNVYDMVGSTSRAYHVGQCFPNVESGAYFQDEAYAIYKRNFELGAVLELQLEFRTSELSGVLLSITAPGNSPSLSLELNNGKVIMSGDLGDNNPLYVEQPFASLYTICDNQWHRIQAVYNDEELALKVDEMDQKYGLPANVNYHIMDSTMSGPLYIGGLPASAPKGTLLTRDHFNGCIRNVMIGGERRDWTDMDELHNIHLSSCPVQ